jgi:hypothetical protein
MIKRLTRYAWLISLVAMTTVVLPEVSLADCTKQDLQKWEKKAGESIVTYKQKKKAYDDYVKTHSNNDQARKLEKQKNDQLALVQKDHDAMKAAGCLAESKLKWPIGINK